MSIEVQRRGPVTIVTIDRPEVRNAIDGAHAQQLHAAFSAFDADPEASVAVLHGRGGTFCAGADLKAVSQGEMAVAAPGDGPAPLGLSRLTLKKPVIAAVEGHAVAGGLELALWADLRVADPNAIFGVFCRRWGVPLIDGGTFRLPRLIGQSHALDMILTGRPVDATEAKTMGLINRVCGEGEALSAALELAEQLAGFPQTCLREDRLALYEQDGLSVVDAITSEWRHGLASLAADTAAGASRFATGAGRHGSFS